MWMMGYNESHEDHMMMNMNMVESYTHNNGGSRKLRPLVPRPPPPATCSATSFNRFHHDHHHHHHRHHQQQQHSAVEQNKREFNAQQMVVVSSRWNPTPEQLQTLEELYRRGTRTPSAEEIQHITAQLRRFGKIEGKNVFYWFQNHKARERQKRRRQLDINPANSKDHLQPPVILSNPDINSINLDHHHPHSIQRKQDSEVIEETRNWAIPTFSEKNVVRERSRKADHQGWIIQPHEEQEQQQEYEHEHEEDEDEEKDLLLLQRRRKSFPAARTTATWNDMMQCLSSSSSTSDQLNNIAGGLNTTTCNPTTTALTVSPFASKTTSSSVVVSSNQSDYETLELFPVNCSSEQPEKCFVQGSDVNFSPRQFIEFLPLKN